MHAVGWGFSDGYGNVSTSGFVRLGGGFHPDTKGCKVYTAKPWANERNSIS